VSPERAQKLAATLNLDYVFTDGKRTALDERQYRSPRDGRGRHGQ
jgi:hypothetical protein